MAKLVHPDGEKEVAKACASRGLVQCISTNASFPIEEIKEAAPDTTFWFQLYVNKERHKTEELLAKVWKLGIRTLVLTVDAPIPGKREADERVKADESMGTPMSGQKAVNDKRGGGYGRIMSGYIDCGLQWSDLTWLKRIWKGRLVIKGIQGVEDARKAVSEGFDGIVIRYPPSYTCRKMLPTLKHPATTAAAASTPPPPPSSSSSNSAETAPKSSKRPKSTSMAVYAVVLIF